MSSDESVDRVSNGRGDEPGQLQQSPGTAEVGRDSQSRRGVGEDAFWIRRVGRFHEQHGVESANLGMPLENRAPRRAAERGEPQCSPAIARQDKLNALGAEAAGPVVQEDGCRDGRTLAHRVRRSGP